MATHSDDIVDLAKRICRDATILAGRDHSPDEFKSLLTRLGTALEVFLKEHVYAGEHNSWKFYRLINELEPLGIGETSKNALHSLRDAYNSAKHDATYEAPIQTIIDIVCRAVQALEELARLRLGNTFQVSGRVTRRLLWFAAWDHIIGGDTEISIFLPAPPEIDMPWGFETIYVDMRAWDNIKAELSVVGKLCIGEACISNRAYDFWSHEGDFLAAGSFEGNLRDMISVFARHERVEDILPDLKRENEPHSMLAAALFASTDLPETDLTVGNQSSLEETIIRIAGGRYAAPGTSKFLKRYAAIVSKLLSDTPLDIRLKLSGPQFVSPVRYAELKVDAVAEAADKFLIVLQDGSLIAKM